jgi:hypothetical protein
VKKKDLSNLDESVNVDELTVQIKECEEEILKLRIKLRDLIYKKRMIILGKIK